MFVIDEAAGVSDRVFEVAEGALASPNSSLLMGGNPTRGTGYFANSHKQNRATTRRCTSAPATVRWSAGTIETGSFVNLAKVRTSSVFAPTATFQRPTTTP
jgi:hypothetical protein